MSHYLTTGVSLLLMMVCAARAQIHPPEPGVNLDDTSFLDGVAGPGLLVEQTIDGSHSDQIRGTDAASKMGTFEKRRNEQFLASGIAHCPRFRNPCLAFAAGLSVLVVPFVGKLVQLAESFTDFLHSFSQPISHGGRDRRLVVPMDKSLPFQVPQPFREEAR